MKNITTTVIAITLLLAGGAARAEPCKGGWDRETPGCTPIGSTAPNKPRTDTNDYGVRYTNGEPALGCRQRMMGVTTSDGRSGQTAVYTCRW
ncbi:MAG: hypothetical protein K2Y27_23005 [Xanthobacteraceae bacterium]|nr:hypothetical protein [Xanthobacteraceae bacterium]